MRRRPFLLLALLLALLSCETEDEALQTEVRFTSIKIVQNDKDGITFEVGASGYLDDARLTDHGVIWLQNKVRVNKLQLGPLKTNPFMATIRSGMRKGGAYEVFPYIALNNREIRGDTIAIISELEKEPKLFDITPRSGFIGDTISIRGEDLCTSRLNFIENYLLLGDGYHVPIRESDSLIKAVISPQVYKSEAEVGLRTCDTILLATHSFVIDEPKLDSISSKLTYAGDELVLYGENVHSDVSKVWLGGEEVPLVRGNSVDTLVVTIPNTLDPGLLDLRLQVIDRFLERSQYYRSTTPVLEEISPMPTGFLDTITLRGKYLDQHSDKLEVLIGGQPQRLLEVKDDVLTVLIDNIFWVNDPFLELHTGQFKLSRPVTMLPPEILSLDKQRYHLDDEVKVKTRFYLGDGSYLKVGGYVQFGGNRGGVSRVDPTGTFNLDLYQWLDLNNPHIPSFSFEESGKLAMQIETAYGVAHHSISIAAPEITGLDAESYSAGTPVEFSGTDFGYKGVSQIYIDEQLVEDPLNSSYSITNYTGNFSLPPQLEPGIHTLKIVTGGQESNKIQLKIRDLTVNSINATSGTRRDIFTITGTNLSNTTTYRILANGKTCTILSAAENKAEFLLPQDQELDPVATLSLEYGPKKIDLGQMAVTEPHERIAGYTLSPDYILDRPGFTYNGFLHFINQNGIYRFDHENLTWTRVVDGIPEVIANGLQSSRIEIPVVGSRIYFAGPGNLLHHYDFSTGNWKEEELNLEEGFNMQRIAVEGNLLVTLMRRNNEFRFVRYDLETHTSMAMSQPGIEINMIYNLNFHHYREKIFIDQVNGDLMMYDLEQDSWENIGFPTPYSFFYHNVLFAYNGKLYLSGGQGNRGAERGLYSYDLQTGSWTEQVPTLDVLTDHVLFASEGNLYFLLGRSLYQKQNPVLSKYVIDEDPY